MPGFLFGQSPRPRGSLVVTKVERFRRVRGNIVERAVRGEHPLIWINEIDAIPRTLHWDVRRHGKAAGFQDVGTDSRRLASMVHFHRRAGRDLRRDLPRRPLVVIGEPDACRLLGSSHLLGSRSRSGQASRRFNRDVLALATSRQREATCQASRSIEPRAVATAGPSG
jgi:hypothetical protein